MHREDRRRPLAHRGGDAPIGVGAYVSGSKYPGHARFERQRVALQRPRFPAAANVFAREDEPLVIGGHERRKRLGARGHTNKDEQRVAFKGRDLAGLRIADVNPLEGVLAVHGDDFRVADDVDVADRRDAIRQVVRHRRQQLRLAHDHRDLLRVA